MQRCLLLFMLATLALGMFPDWLRAAPVALKFAMTPNENTPSGQAAQKLQALLESKFKGKLEVTFHPNGQLGTELQLLKRMQGGEPIVNFVSTVVISNIHRSFSLLDLPFPFTDHDHVKKVLNGPIGRQLEGHLLSKGFRVLAWWDIGFSTIATTRKPLKSFDDFKGLRVRISETPVLVEIFKTMGMHPLAMSFKDAKKALVEQNLDGFWTLSLANVYESKFHEVVKYVYWGKLTYGARPLVIAESVWSQLPPEIQKGFKEALDEVTPWQLARARQSEAVYEKKLKDAGVEVVKFSAAEEDRMKQQLQAIWSRYEPLIGKELLQELQRSH